VYQPALSLGHPVYRLGYPAPSPPAAAPATAVAAAPVSRTPIQASQVVKTASPGAAEAAAIL
jgi:hypothetical protein